MKRSCLITLLLVGSGVGIAQAQTTVPTASPYAGRRSISIVGPRYAAPEYAAPTQARYPMSSYTSPAPAFSGSSPGADLPIAPQSPAIIRTGIVVEAVEPIDRAPATLVVQRAKRVVPVAVENEVNAPPQPPTLAAVNAAVPPESIPVGQVPGTFGLGELQGMALFYNPILRRAEAEIEAAKGERVQAGLYPNPSMETNNPEVFAGATGLVNFGYQQFIVVKGKLRLDKAAADQLVRRATAEFRLERSRMLTEVRKQYYETLAAKHRINLARYLTEIAERGLNGSRQLEKAGEGTRTDVLLLDTEFQREQVRLLNAETTYQGELKQLAAVVGMPEVVIQDVDGTLFDVPPQFDEQDVLAFLNNAGSYIERARADVMRSQIQLRRQEVEPYPNVRMGPSFQTGTIPHSAQFWLTVEFNIPVYDLNQGNIRKANATVQEQLAELEVLRNELHRKTAELFAKHKTSRDRAERIRVQILPNAQQARNLVQDGYVKGEFDVNRLLESQRNLAEVSSDYFEAAEESWVTAAELAGMLQLEQFP